MSCRDDVSLLGIRQLYKVVAAAAIASKAPQHAQQAAAPKEWRLLLEARFAALLGVLGSVSFHQAVVFCNWRRDAEDVAARLQVGHCWTLQGGGPAGGWSGRFGQGGVQGGLHESVLLGLR